MSRFILNDIEIHTSLPPGTLLLDFIRYHQHLTGTKIGCREGDCGACTILVGELKNEDLVYTSATSCLMPLGNAEGKHIVTIEGLNVDGLNAVQQAFTQEGATQCGFCTPGFIVSLAGFCMNANTPTYNSAIDAMNGNICRCTGYKSIGRAAVQVNEMMQGRKDGERYSFAVEKNVIPSYFLDIQARLQKIKPVKKIKPTNGTQHKILGGGTDLYVQQHETMAAANIDFLFDAHFLNGISREENTCVMGASVTAADISGSEIFRSHFPELQKYIKLVSSTPIRNMATVAGNFCNASPIGDFTIFFLALDAQLLLTNGTQTRTVPLRQFYKGYKQMDKSADEVIEKISFELPAPNSYFNFEKVSKRTHLDIASVNTALYLQLEGDIIESAGLSAGGVGPVPIYLKAGSDFLKGKKIEEAVINELLAIIQTEISPISDARGTGEYKRLLLQQLVKAHLKPLTPKGGPKK